ncbi:hypothetical protein [Mucilaginibacter sp.]|jgi:hypothetical protein|uniref:hypothetical protein n=1 Tax=Mucilaginibacter sp. TaxID=1882438 RepID=UPI002BC20DAF|nr:hypothetical protein [Mucilaginibacter sp.]HTI58320.1 hypothetical protein [Mucilaginibacter sp.]
MKLAFLFGSNVFIIPNNIISYVDNDQTNIFLKIRSIFRKNTAQSALMIDADLKDTEGRGLTIHDNEIVSSFGYKVSKTPDRILAKGLKNDTVFDIQQLDSESATQLDRNILAELRAHSPDAVLRISGDFMMGKMHVAVNNDRLSIGRDSYYASEARAGVNELTFTPSGLVVA